MSVTLLTCPRLVFNARDCSLGADNAQKNNEVFFLHFSRTKKENDKTNGREEKECAKNEDRPDLRVELSLPEPKSLSVCLLSGFATSDWFV